MWLREIYPTLKCEGSRIMTAMRVIQIGEDVAMVEDLSRLAQLPGRKTDRVIPMDVGTLYRDVVVDQLARQAVAVGANTQLGRRLLGMISHARKALTPRPH